MSAGKDDPCKRLPAQGENAVALDLIMHTSAEEYSASAEVRIGGGPVELAGAVNLV